MSRQATVIFAIFFMAIAMALLALDERKKPHPGRNPIVAANEARLARQQPTTTPTQQPTQPVSQYLIDQEPVFHIIGLDVDKDQKVSADSIKQGNDAVLFLARKGSIASGEAGGANANEHIFVFNQLSSLANFDLDKNGEINTQDPVYSHLLIGQYNPITREMEVRHLTDTGIHVIFYDPGHILMGIQGDFSRFKEAAGRAIGADGSSIRIQIVPMYERFFKRTRLKPSERLRGR